ncbi:MAG TPA: hypothetical protein VGV14_05765 [Rhodanobacter sp.]|nr:hypothetical protein [Rhodanobacter sp.]
MAGFNAIHTKVLCEAFGSKGMEITVNDGLMQQRVLSALLLAFSAASYVVRRRRFQQVRTTYAVKSLLAFREAATDQEDGAPPSSLPSKHD